MDKRNYYVYVLADEAGKHLHTGVTPDLRRRMEEYRLGLIEGSAKKNKAYRLVHLEWFLNPFDAVSREEQMKSFSIDELSMFVNRQNVGWKDLYESILNPVHKAIAS